MKEVPSFSSFTTIDPALTDIADNPQNFQWLVAQILFEENPYPAGELDDEIKRLVALSDQRDPSLIEKHTREYADIFAIELGEGKTLGDYIGPKGKPLTNELYTILLNDVEIMVAREKLRFDIARPRQISLAVNSPVDTPSTPSYPSMFAAKATLASVVLSTFMKSDEYDIVSRYIDEAIARTHIVGISTQFDTDYGSALARDYAEVTLPNEKGKEFLQLTKNVEWSGKPVWRPSNQGQILPNAVVGKPSVFIREKGHLFTASIENNGPGITPSTVPITLEIDRYGDGSVERRINFSIGGIAPGRIKDAQYLLGIAWPGDHLFRFVVNNDLDFQEVYHHDNYGVWTPFSVSQ
jgi:hypothetical protein